MSLILLDVERTSNLLLIMLALDLGRDKEEAQQKTRPEKLSSRPGALLCLSRVEEGKKHTDNGLFPGRRVDDATTGLGGCLRMLLILLLLRLLCRVGPSRQDCAAAAGDLAEGQNPGRAFSEP